MAIDFVFVSFDIQKPSQATLFPVQQPGPTAGKQEKPDSAEKHVGIQRPFRLYIMLAAISIRLIVVWSSRFLRAIK